MKISTVALTFALACLGFSLMAQDFSLGVRAGLNRTTIQGPLETDDNGNQLERYEYTSGFHVYVTFTYPFTELMGLRGEFGYSQTGVDRLYDGPSYYIFEPLDNPRYATGTGKINLSVTNSFLEFPITAYLRPVPWLELFGGGKLGFMVSSTAFGDLTFEGKASNGSPVSVKHELDFRYFLDKPGRGTFIQPVNTVTIGGDKVPYPHIGGAYFMFSEDRGKLYRAVELAAVAGLAVYPKDKLYLSLRIHKGITDLTKSQADVSWYRLDSANQFISRDDKDTNLTWQASIGFHF